ncbi:MAG: cation:proton antiporter [Candidatus Omnitrophica bacterium]|nr:cation:proton antiporter [Candidatus Omnitrophota bacterium]MDD5487890.1 cation:proton antiporter [Candidatus Omnitrophota bacterium]
MKNKKFFLITFGIICVILSCFPAMAEDKKGSSDLVSDMAMLMLQIGIVLFAAWGGGTLFKKFKLPEVLGEIVSGIFIGPYLLGALPLPSFPNGLFPLHPGLPISIELYSLSVIASIILLFLVGVETDVEMLFRFSVTGLVVGIGGVIISFLAGAFGGAIFMSYVLERPLDLLQPIPLFLGVISTATSVGITARVLSSNRKIDSPEGVTILSAAVIDDVLGIIAFAVVIGIIRSGHVVWRDISIISLKAIGIWLGFTVLGLTFSRQISSFLKKYFSDRSTMAVMSFALALLLAGIFEKSGLAMIIGAYVMGISLSKTDISFVIRENLDVLNKLFVPLFFCVMGMLIDLRELFHPAVIYFGLLYTLLAVIGKIAGCSIPSLFLNFTPRGALRIGVGMVPRGEVALIIAGIGLALGFIPHDVFSLAIIMTFITTLITPPVLDTLLRSDKPALRRSQQVKKGTETIKYTLPNPETTELILTKIVAAFESEGFFVHRITITDTLYQIRKNDIFFSMRQYPHELVFECSGDDTYLVHTVFYEVIAELEELIKNLESVSDKEKIARDIFGHTSSGSREKLNLYQIIKPLAVTTTLSGETKDEILAELVDLLVRAGELPMEKRDVVLKDLLEREATMSTGMQDGVALPHTKTMAVDHLISGVGVKKDGVEFDALDRKPAQIFVITLAPKANQEPYLQFMAEVTKVLINPEARKKILSCSTDKELFTTLTSST